MPIRLLIAILEVILLTAVITGIINYSRKYRPMLFLLLLLLYTCISEGVAFYSSLVYRMAHPVNHVYNCISIVLYTIFFYDVIINKKLRTGIMIFGGAVIVFSILNPIFFQDIFSSSSNTNKVKTPYLFLAGSILLMQQLDLPGERKIFRDPVFLSGLTLVWFNIISSIFFFFNDLRSKYNLQLPIMYWAHYISNYIHYFIFFLAMVYLKNYKSYARELPG